MRREQRGRDLGRAEIRPADAVVAGRPSSWDIVFTCGTRGVDRGGALRFDIPYGFTPPQTSYSWAAGYTTVEASSTAVRPALHLRDPKTRAGNQGSWALHLYVQIEEGDLEPGEIVTLHYGSGHGALLAGQGARARSFEGEAEFAVLVDPDGSRGAPHGGFWLIGDPLPRLRVIGDRPSRLFLVVPSIVRPGQSFPLKMTVRDPCENTVPAFEGNILVASPDAVDRTCTMQRGDRGRCSIAGVAVPGEGVFRVAARSPDAFFGGLSNPCLAIDRPDALNLYWGDIHVMTELSAGLGRPGTAYEYARDVSHLDVCAVTDGDDADAYLTDAEWEETKQAVRAFYAPGRFVTLLASEYHERRVAGDKNIYYRSDEAELVRWSDLRSEQPGALWEFLAGSKALTVPHHTVSGSASFRPWDHHDPRFQRLVEIYSIWGNSECEGCLRPNYWRNNFDNSVQNGLARGYRMGIIASGDSHDGLPGNSSWMRVRQGYRNGLVAVYAPELTREAVFDALWERSCYGTSGARIILSFTLNGAPMGRELNSDADRSRRQLRVRAVGTDRIREITVVRNGEDVRVHRGTSEDEAFEWTDEEDFDAVSLTDYQGAPFIYYYIRVLQEDGELAWSSPIWIS